MRTHHQVPPHEHITSHFRYSPCSRLPRCHFSSRLKHLYNDAHPTASPTSHIRTAQEQVTVEFRIEITQGGLCHVCRCAAAAHGIRQEYCERSSQCFTQPSYIPPRLKYGIAGHFWLRRRHPCASVYGAVGFRTVHEVSDNNVSHSHRGSIAVSLSACQLTHGSICMAIL